VSDGLCIAHVHTTAGWGGGENQVLRLMTGLRERGVKAVLFARARGELLRRALGLGLPARSLPRLLAARHVARALAEEPFDVVHVHDSRAVAIGTRAARARGIPVVASRRVASPLRRNPVSHRKYSPRRLDLGDCVHFLGFRHDALSLLKGGATCCSSRRAWRAHPSRCARP